MIFLRCHDVICHPTKLKDLADDSFKLNKNGRKFSIRVESVVGKKEKLLVTSSFSFSQCFQKTCTTVMQKPGLFENVFYPSRDKSNCLPQTKPLLRTHQI